MGRASVVLQGLSIPNGLDEGHRNLLSDLIRTVRDLESELAKVKDQAKLSSEEIAALKTVKEGLPVWRENWNTFIAAAGGAAAGTVVAGAASYSAAYTAGFIAGVLHDTFSPGVSCIT